MPVAIMLGGMGFGAGAVAFGIASGWSLFFVLLAYPLIGSLGALAVAVALSLCPLRQDMAAASGLDAGLSGQI